MQDDMLKGFLNLTPHVVRVLKQDGSFMKIEPCGIVPRLSAQSVKVGTNLDVPIFKTVFGETKDLPNKRDNILLIVSAMVRTANPTRDDLVSPKELIRDDNGNIIGCEGFDVNL